MERQMVKDLRYPIGEFDKTSEVTAELRAEFIGDIANLPAELRKAVDGLNEKQLETNYRAGGWTVRQVVHHIADSHLNAYIRFKLALTEDAPTIRPYFENRWAELADSRMPVENSLILIESLHKRWTRLLESMADEDFARILQHPESGEWTLEKMLGLYVWHGRHHTAHITTLAEREGW